MGVGLKRAGADAAQQLGKRRVPRQIISQDKRVYKESN